MAAKANPPAKRRKDPHQQTRLAAALRANLKRRKAAAKDEPEKPGRPRD